MGGDWIQYPIMLTILRCVPTSFICSISWTNWRLSSSVAFSKKQKTLKENPGNRDLRIGYTISVSTKQLKPDVKKKELIKMKVYLTYENKTQLTAQVLISAW